MCEHCEHYKPILENDNNIVFMIGNRLILQDKSNPKINPRLLIDDIIDGVQQIAYDSKWVVMNIENCPFCNAKLKFVKE